MRAKLFLPIAAVALVFSLVAPLSFTGGGVVGVNEASATGDVGCVYSKGAYKNNEDIWPIPTDTPYFFDIDSFGNVTALELLHLKPRGGNMLLIAAQQHLVAVNNWINTDSLPSSVDAALGVVQTELVEAETGGVVDFDALEDAKDILDAYNNGLKGVPKCN